MFRYNDEELLYLSKQGCPIAKEALYQMYYQYIEVIVKTSGAYKDIRDTSQVIMVACMKAFEAYRPDRQCRLKTFMTRVIKNTMYTILKKQSRAGKNYPMLSLDEAVYMETSLSYEDIIADEKDTIEPRKALLVKEAKKEYLGYANTHCSNLEKNIMLYRMAGYSRKDIASQLEIDVKVIYNAMYRLQKKLQRVNMFD